MSVSGLSPTRPLGGISGILQVASLLGLVLLLLKAAQLYLCRQWLLKAFQEFPCPPSHWLYGHRREVGRARALRAWSAGPSDKAVLCDEHVAPGKNPKSLGTYRFLDPWIGKYGMVYSSGPGKTWFQPQWMLTQAFHYNILKPYVALMANTERVNVLFPPQDKWEELISQDLLLEIFGHISLMTLDIIMKCAFSHQGSRQGHDNPSAVGPQQLLNSI
uniref:Uncharacterized protein n=1 Tax=Equus caballus TaxID=9796 RepID=A0A9L0RTM3_HORSE